MCECVDNFFLHYILLICYISYYYYHYYLITKDCLCGGPSKSNNEDCLDKQHLRRKYNNVKGIEASKLRFTATHFLGDHGIASTDREYYSTNELRAANFDQEIYDIQKLTPRCAACDRNVL